MKTNSNFMKVCLNTVAICYVLAVYLVAGLFGIVFYLLIEN